MFLKKYKTIYNFYKFCEYETFYALKTKYYVGEKNARPRIKISNKKRDINSKWGAPLFIKEKKNSNQNLSMKKEARYFQRSI